MNKYSLHQSKGSAGEPLFTLSEISEKISIPINTLSAYMKHHSGLVPWRNVAQTDRHSTPIGMYRISDFKKWWASFERKK